MMNDNNSAQHQLQTLMSSQNLCHEQALFEIDAQGNCFYQQGPLPDKFSRLFYSILHGIDGQFLLITPVERVRVEVAAFPLLIVDYNVAQDGRLCLTTSIGTEFIVENHHAFEIQAQDIFVSLPRGLSAKLGRACYYRFVDEYLLDSD
ncbi:DUF1285 domain-containing protein [Shewanella colwelliana]|nr:DUF1285 domain-containing protein [Shewanella colwelliana]